MKKLKIKQDVLHLNNAENLIIATDNSGAIGEKKCDEVKVSYEEVAYFLFRVTFMDLVAAGGQAESLILHNFNGDSAWKKLLEGLIQGVNEAKLPSLSITGSSESNFDLKQSATSLSMIGRKRFQQEERWRDDLVEEYHLAVVGRPLVGEELLQYPEAIASLESFYWFSQQKEVIGLVPVGSKGIRSELKKISDYLPINFPNELELEKSAGPSTCYIMIYKKDFEEQLIEKNTGPIFKGNWIE